MGGLAHYIESEGVPTTQISLVRLHTEKIRPPRALWVPFILGRPFGAPNEPEFQKRVIIAALRLLEADAGPRLEDFSDEAPPAPAEADGWACALPAPPPEDAADETASLIRAFLEEVSSLSSWYTQARASGGRTAVGASGLAPADIGPLLSGLLTGETPDGSRPDIKFPWLVKLAAEDLKAYYFEAIAARPGFTDPGPRRLEDWYWGETCAGRVLQRLKKELAGNPDAVYSLLSKLLLVPMSQSYREVGSD